jgi:hypothetical protein
VDLKAGLDTEVRGKNPLPLPGIEHRSPGRPARNQTLYCLSYPAPVYSHLRLFVWCILCNVVEQNTPLQAGSHSVCKDIYQRH